MTKICNHYQITSHHPCFAGHFPDNPIVPGVIILDYIRELFEQYYKNQSIKQWSRIKFTFPLRPERPFSLHLHDLKITNKIKFYGLCEQQTIIQGVFIHEKRL